MREIPPLTGDTARDIRLLHGYLTTLHQDAHSGDIRADDSGLVTFGNGTLNTLRVLGSLALLRDSDFVNTPDPLPNTPAAPANPVATVWTDITISVRWDLPTDPSIKAFEVQRANDNGFTTSVSTRTITSSLQYVDDYLGNGVTRYYRVRAIRDNGQLSDWSTVVNGTT